MHGFLNVFCAAVLIHAGVLAKSELAVLLGDESPEHFSFDDNGFAWKDARATLEEVSEARYDLIVSFGSCSFDEPLSYLRELGLL